MRIAFVSHEFPPETGGGGIGTYLQVAAGMLTATGHQVEIFAGTSGPPTVHEHPDGYRVHRVPSPASPDFAIHVLPAFAKAHQARPFDVIEGNDFDASALAIKEAFPSVPLVVKLHTPRFVIDQLQWRRPRVLQRMRMTLGAFRRGRLPSHFHPAPAPGALREQRQLELADEIAAPSQAIADHLIAAGFITCAKVSVFPYPYRPPREVLEIPVGGGGDRVLFLGRLEVRKGVIDLADAIPLVLKQVPHAKFRFVGRAMPAPDGRQDMRSFLLKRLGRYAAAVEILEPVTPALVPQLLAECTVLAAPSHWESFGLVCCEGMAAGRAVVGSSNGGMAEILEGGRYGILVTPHRPAELATRLVELLRDPPLCSALGKAAREHATAHFSPNLIQSAQVASYHRAMAHAAARRVAVKQS